MKYKIEQIQDALYGDQKLKAKAMFESYRSLIANRNMLSESDSQNAQKFDETVDAAEQSIKSLKSPADFQKFVERNKDKIEAALKKMPEDKKPKYQKAWDLVCKAASGTVSFIAKNFLLIAEAVLILGLGWIFRDKLKWLIDALSGNHADKQFEKYQQTAIETHKSSSKFTNAMKDLGKDKGMFHQVVQDYKKSENGQKWLKKLLALPGEYASAQQYKREAAQYIKDYNEDPSMGKRKWREFGKSYKDALAGVLRGAWATVTGSDEKDPFTGYYTDKDIENQGIQTQWFNDAHPVIDKIKQICDGAANVDDAKRKLYKFVHATEWEAKNIRSIYDQKLNDVHTLQKATSMLNTTPF